MADKYRRSDPEYSFSIPEKNYTRRQPILYTIILILITANIFTFFIEESRINQSQKKNNDNIEKLNEKLNNQNKNICEMNNVISNFNTKEKEKLNTILENLKNNSTLPPERCQNFPR
ncbi:hypothetical protein ANSO36C_21770 [Nostoc cf. commune SO-36]|uniref:Cell division protein FtsL n=1 Tax=Nostoc cf. commune SO-36 TaxID=449208 RepID=A0ABN6Q2B3_NOSCO|nr:hypothetical protein [Nostoc commune]BDI16375.1 hypothetical protein ANSO36C_21770 [Nostoc cf. commune SO-36]